MAKAAGTANAKTTVPALRIDDKAPEFLLNADDGKEVSLNDFRGKRVLLFFFPKANTPG
jgi:thioredoxin-dependent peroxiredoxin